MAKTKGGRRQAKAAGRKGGKSRPSMKKAAAKKK